MDPQAPEIPPQFLEAVRALRRDHPEAPSRYRLPLTLNTFGDLELAAALEALVRGPMTQGPRVALFESEFAQAHAAADAVFCNSGSSANLLVIQALTRPRGGDAGPAIRPGDEVVVPAVTWPTTLWPVAQAGAIPVLADVSPLTLNLTVDSVERALSPRTRAVFAVHLLGTPAPAPELAALCRKRGLTLIEDCCEALDAEIGNRRVGTFGRMGTFSFYFSHHICTIEGGMILCARPEDGEGLRVLRAHGWTRQMADAPRRAVEAAHPDLDPRFLFVDAGYNLRGTDLQAAIGRVQLARREQFLARRREVAAIWAAARDRHPGLFLPVEAPPGASHFAFPLVLRREASATRRRLTEFLETRGVETRPLVAGNLARQPALGRMAHRVAGPLAGADLLHERAIYVGLHPRLTDDQVAYLPVVIEEFAREVGA
jgi:CDP-4-dehydro-6-deoxyglucose reductase, E1